MNLAKRLIIIDGFNVLRCGERYKPLSGQAPNFNDWQDEPFNHAREKLIDDASTMADTNTKVIIVFDGMDNEYSVAKQQKVGNVKIVFSAFRFSADEEIINRVHHNSAHNHTFVVVSDDNVLQEAIGNHNVLRMSVSNFCSNVSQNSIFDSDSVNNCQEKSKETIMNLIDEKQLIKMNELFDKLSTG